jgi:hypothetical protein
VSAVWDRYGEDSDADDLVVVVRPSILRVGGGRGRLVLVPSRTGSRGEEYLKPTQ